MDQKPYHLLLLQKEFDKRKGLNSRYSMRAFAKFLGILPSSLSRILTNKTELSPTTAKKVMKKLKLSYEERLMFITSYAEEVKSRIIKMLEEELNDNHEYHSKKEGFLTVPMVDAVFVIDRSGRCIFTNEAGAGMHGLLPSQIIGKTLREVGTPEEVAKRITTYAEKVFQTNQPLTLQDSFPTKERLRWYEKRLYPLLGKDGEVQAVASYLKDITEMVSIDFRLNLLARVSEILTAPDSIEDALNSIGNLLLEELAEGCIIRLIVKEESQVIYVNHNHIEQKKKLEELITRFPLNANDLFDFQKANANQTFFIKKVDEEYINTIATSSAHLELLNQIDCSSLIVSPILVGKDLQGMFTLLRGQEFGLFTRDDCHTVSEVTARVALALKSMKKA